MKFYAIVPCAALATTLFATAAFADPTTPPAAPPARPATAPTPAAPTPPQGPQRQPPAPKQLNYAYVPSSLLTVMGTLSADEQTKIADIESKLQSDVNALRTPGPNPDYRTKMRALYDQADTDIRALLTPDQITAIDSYVPSIELLFMTVKGGPGAVSNLNITHDQLDKFKGIEDDLAQKQKDLTTEMNQKRQALLADATNKANDVLTADQKASLAPKPAPATAPTPAPTTPTR